MIEALLEGCSVMLVGMGTVLVFLFIMIVSMHIMAYAIKYLNKICPEPVAVTTKNTKKSSSNDEEVALAVAVAMFADK